MDRRKFLKRTGATVVGAAATTQLKGDRAAEAQTPGMQAPAAPVRTQSKKRTPRRKVLTSRAPRPAGPYSQAIVTGNTIYVAGQVPYDPQTGKVIDGPFEDHAVRVFENIKAIVEAAGASLADVVKVNVYLEDLDNFAKMNEVYRRYFAEDFPVRTTVGAKLSSGLLIEADCIAVK